MRQPTRRNMELLLLVMAWGIGVLGTAQVAWATGDGIPPRFWITVGVVGCLALLAHAIVRWRLPYADPLMLPIVTLLTIIGMIMIYRLDVAAAQRAERTGVAPPTPDVYFQLAWFAVGIVGFLLVILIIRDHRVLRRYSYTLGLIGLILLLLPLVPGIGATVNGATRWVRVGGFTIQPVEFAKIALAVFFAGYLVVHRESLAIVRTRILGVGIPRLRDLGPIVVAWVVALLILVVQKDLGSSLLIFGLFVSMLYVATQRRSWFVLATILLAVGAVFAYLSFAHVRVRFQVWLDPFAYADTGGFQIVQSLYGFANGGLLGTGLGNGYPNLVPFANTDFVIAALGEELGLAGVMALLLMYAVLVERGLRVSVAVRDPFGQLLAAGLSITMALQVFVIVGGVTRLIPLTGLTTPFLSYGGSSLVANWLIIALLLVISHRARMPARDDSSAGSASSMATEVVRR
jgi:cell division protein FtsW (lipid II flippase)